MKGRKRKTGRRQAKWLQSFPLPKITELCDRFVLKSISHPDFGIFCSFASRHLSFHPALLSSIVLHPFHLPIVYHRPSLVGPLFPLSHRCLMMVIFYPGPSVSWCGEALGPLLFLMRHDVKLPRALCCQIVTHCLVEISRQTPAHAHTHTQTPLITCINYTVWDHHSDHSCADPALLSGSLWPSRPCNSNSVVAVRCNSI